jgi:hypothetical protein
LGKRRHRSYKIVTEGATLVLAAWATEFQSSPENLTPGEWP